MRVKATYQWLEPKPQKRFTKQVRLLASGLPVANEVHILNQWR